MTIGNNIKRLRQQRMMTQEELATQVGITQGQLSEYENDKVDVIPIDKLGRIADVLQVSVAVIDERLLQVPGLAISGNQNVLGSGRDSYGGTVIGHAGSVATTTQLDEAAIRADERKKILNIIKASDLEVNLKVKVYELLM